MKDIPFFTTEYGVAALILREIPYREDAYIRLHTASDPVRLIEECKQFCCMAGAKRIYATGNGIADDYPLHSTVISMRGQLQNMENYDGALWPVQSHTLETFKRIYNEKSLKIDHASWMDDKDSRQMLERGDGYFVHKNQALLGIGRVYDGQLLFVASVYPGAGADVVKALCSVLHGDSVTLDVASTNRKAIRLYENLGFIPVGEKIRWHKIL